MGRTDRIYNGDRTKWLKLAYGLRAMNQNHYSNKSTYKPDEVIADVDNSFTSNADDALSRTRPQRGRSSDYNFLGRTRNNITHVPPDAVRGQPDERHRSSAAWSIRACAACWRRRPTALYRGLDINMDGFGALTTAQQPNNFFGYAARAARAAGSLHLRRQGEDSAS